MNCVCCKGTVFPWKELSILHCDACGHGILSRDTKNPFLKEESFTKRFHNLENTPQSRGLSALRLSFIQSFWNRRGLIVDLGCSVGSFMKVAIKHGYKAIGYDSSPFASLMASKSGLQVIQADIQSLDGYMPKAGCFTLFDVLEHIDDPLKLMTSVRKSLDTDGVVVISTPDSTGVTKTQFPSWRHYKPDEHKHYFTVNSLDLLLKKSGLNSLLKTNLESEIRVNSARETNNILTVVANGSKD